MTQDTPAASDDGQKMLELGGLQNKAWASDTSKFGYKMLMKMGWSAGKGLGKNLEGRAAHVHLKKRTDNLGLGCSLKQAEVAGWTHTSKGFAEILADLNQEYTTEKKEKKKSKKSKKVKKEKKAKKEKKTTLMKNSRILFTKRVMNKNAKSYSAADMSAILGVASTAATPFVQVDAFASAEATSMEVTEESTTCTKKPSKKKSKSKSKKE